MGLLTFDGVGISGIAAAVPSKVINNYEHDLFFSKEEIKEVVDKIGVKERRFADENTCASDLCYAAAEELISGMNINREEIDLLIFISQTPDYRMPATSVLLQERLKLSTSTITFDISLGCSAFMYGLSVAYSMIIAGGVRKALILDGETRDYIANHNLEEIVRTSNRVPIPSGAVGEEVGDTLIDIMVGREKIQDMILESANNKVTDLGIAILDFRVKRIIYIEDVRTQVYERMKSERYRIADKFRAEGQGEASRINGEKERDLKIIQSVAFRQAEEIMGKADAKATAIYAGAYNQTSASRNLYSFLKSMETFEHTFDTATTVVLSTKSELYKYLINLE